jgi:osmotically-inducible protein OsmY
MSDPRDTEPSIEPSTRECGVWGTKSDAAGAVGGFGESYQAQAARGAEPALADTLPDPAEEAPEDAPLGREVRKTLARAHVDAADLRVAHVTLLGSVREPLERAQIEARARAIPGVAQVTNRLSVVNEPGRSS